MRVSTPYRRRLLLVEDDQMVRETIMLMLEDEYDLMHAAAVSDALARIAAETGRIDLMLLDCLLPSGNVTDVLAAADAHAIPVVLISGDPEKARALDGRRRFLAKPFSQATLLSALDSARR